MYAIAESLRLSIPVLTLVEEEMRLEVGVSRRRNRAHGDASLDVLDRVLRTIELRHDGLMHLARDAVVLGLRHLQGRALGRSMKEDEGDRRDEGRGGERRRKELTERELHSS